MSLVISVIDQYRDKPNAATVVLNGRMNDSGAKLLDYQMEQVDSQSISLLAFDLSNLSYINSAGLKAIYKGVARMKEANGRCGVVHMQPQIRKVFDIVKALPDVSIFKSDGEFDEYLDCMQLKAS